MKRLKIALLAFSVVVAFSCKDNNSEEKTTNDTSETKTAEKYVVKPEATSVKWTAYKTTEKKPVGGEFTTLNFDIKEGSTPEEALNGLEFEIPVKNLFTKDAGRDEKIKNFFFGKMLNTALISGTIKHFNNRYVCSLTMNGVTKDLPLIVTISDKRRVEMKGVMQLADWNALDALASLNEVCFDLHKGADGVSKTWEEVAIEVNTYLRKN